MCFSYFCQPQLVIVYPNNPIRIDFDIIYQCIIPIEFKLKVAYFKYKRNKDRQIKNRIIYCNGVGIRRLPLRIRNKEFHLMLYCCLFPMCTQVLLVGDDSICGVNECLKHLESDDECHGICQEEEDGNFDDNFDETIDRILDNIVSSNLYLNKVGNGYTLVKGNKDVDEAVQTPLKLNVEKVSEIKLRSGECHPDAKEDTESTNGDYVYVGSEEELAGTNGKELAGMTVDVPAREGEKRADSIVQNERKSNKPQEAKVVGIVEDRDIVGSEGREWNHVLRSEHESSDEETMNFIEQMMANRETKTKKKKKTKKYYYFKNKEQVK